MKQHIIIFGTTIILGIILITGCVQNAQEKPAVKENSITKNEVSVCELANNPTLYINKTIHIEAIVKFVGESYWAQKGDFFIEDDNCQIQVFGWAPTTVAHCPPTVKDCKAPPTMETYLDKKVRLNGILGEFPKKEYIEKKWTVVGTYYVVSDVANVSIIP